MSSIVQNPKPQWVKQQRLLLLTGGMAYLIWWGLVELFLPGSYNPLPSRLLATSSFGLVLILSYLFKPVVRHLSLLFYACAWLTTFHYFYLFHHNPSDSNWVVGAYVTVVAFCACLESQKALLYYALYVAGLSLLLTTLDPNLLKTVFLSGMGTILAFAYFALRTRLQLGKELKDNAKRLQVLFDALFEGLVVSERGEIVDLNGSFLAMFGYTREETLSKSVKDFVVVEHRETVQAHIDGQIESPYEVTGLRKNGSVFPIEVYAKHHLFEGKTLRITAIRDITDSKKIERNRLLLEASREALKMSDEFISIASHELKTPLTTIKIQTEMAQLKLQKEDSVFQEKGELRSFVETVSRQADRLTHLVEDMLYSSKLSFGKVILASERFNLSDLTQKTIQSLSTSFRQARCDVSFRSENEIFIEADLNRIEQLLLNLLSNSLKYSQGKPILVSLSTDSSNVTLTVEDQGIGIALEDQERIFKRFERAVSSKRISGMGLGLFICKQIVEAHEGHIEVKSTLGEGARFTVVLPLQQKETKSV